MDALVIGSVDLLRGGWEEGRGGGEGSCFFGL